LPFIGVNFIFAEDTLNIGEEGSANVPGSEAWLAAPHTFAEWADYFLQLLAVLHRSGKFKLPIQ